MYSDPTCPLPTGACADQSYRLAVYEAGHALTARALGLRVLSVRMLPRPPVLVSDKTFVGNNWASLSDTLENRIIELFGGQIAEEHACATNTCCSGDVARIDELARLVAGLDGERDSDTIYFDLEDVALEIFAEKDFRAAIVPIAEFLYAHVQNDQVVIDGKDVEAELDKHVPPLPEKDWKKRLFSFGRNK